MAILRGPTPGMIEDRRYAMFGLADKTQFTQSEYNELKEKYPDFDDFYVNIWKPYTELLKEDITQKTKLKDTFEERVVAIQAELSDLQAKLQKMNDAISEQQSLNTATSEALIEMFNTRKEETLGKIDALNDELSNAQNTISDLEAEIEQYNTDKSKLEAAIESYLSKVNGKNPLNAG